MNTVLTALYCCWQYSRTSSLLAASSGGMTFGHPSNRTDGSQVQWYCWGTTHRVSVFDSRQELGCNFGGGASGGPWLENYSSNGLGSAISNTSTITSGGDNRGPYYDDHTADVYRAAENASP